MRCADCGEIATSDLCPACTEVAEALKQARLAVLGVLPIYESATAG